MGKGFQRYANSKLATLMWTYALDSHLQKLPPTSNVSKITAIVINPGNLSDSRALKTNTPPMLQYLSRFIIQPLRPLMRFMDPTMRTARDAGIDVAKLATNTAFPGERGFFTMLKKDVSSPASLDVKVQEALWEKTLQWTGVNRQDINML